MQDRSRQLDENLLQRTAGPYIWVNRVILVVGRLLPVFPWKRTSSGPVAMSQNGMDRPCSRPEPFRE